MQVRCEGLSSRAACATAGCCADASPSRRTRRSSLERRWIAKPPSSHPSSPCASRLALERRLHSRRARVRSPRRLALLRPPTQVRRPLRAGEERRLNLFEPRWLALLDNLAASTAASTATSVRREATGAAAGAACGCGEQALSSLLVNASFGCVFAVNEQSVPAAVAASGFAEGVGGGGGGGASSTRIDDVVIPRVGRRARIVRIEEGVRPVTGARRLVVWLVGEEPLAIDDRTLHPTGGGHLSAVATPCDEAAFEIAHGPIADALDGGTRAMPEVAGDASGSVAGDASGSVVRALLVVGLAHANGVLVRVADQRMRPPQRLPQYVDERAGGGADDELEPGWVGWS